MPKTSFPLPEKNPPFALQVLSFPRRVTNPAAAATATTATSQKFPGRPVTWRRKEQALCTASMLAWQLAQVPGSRDRLGAISLKTPSTGGGELPKCKEKLQLKSRGSPQRGDYTREGREAKRRFGKTGLQDRVQSSQRWGNVEPTKMDRAGGGEDRAF